jgi:hypothetical protein
LALRPATVLVAVLLAFSATAQSQTIPVSVKNDPGGFSTQYKQIFDYYKKENYFGMTAAFQSFKLPPEWFVETFGPDAGPKLQLHYEYEFSLFVTETEKLYGPLNVALINFVDPDGRVIEAEPIGREIYVDSPSARRSPRLEILSAVIEMRTAG